MYEFRTNADLTSLINRLQLAYKQSTCFIEHLTVFSANLENHRVLQNPLTEFLNYNGIVEEYLQRAKACMLMLFITNNQSIRQIAPLLLSDFQSLQLKNSR